VIYATSDKILATKASAPSSSNPIPRIRARKTANTNSASMRQAQPKSADQLPGPKKLLGALEKIFVALETLDGGESGLPRKRSVSPRRTGERPPCQNARTIGAPLREIYRRSNG